MGFFRKRFGPFISMILTAVFIRVDYVAIFGSRIPAVSLSFSSEKSYSPSRLVCAHDIGECDEIADRSLSFEGVLDFV